MVKWWRRYDVEVRFVKSRTALLESSNTTMALVIFELKDLQISKNSHGIF
jgi:hypothetical protein